MCCYFILFLKTTTEKSRSRSIHRNMGSKTRCELKTKERTKPQFWKYPYWQVLTPQYIWIKIWLQVVTSIGLLSCTDSDHYYLLLCSPLSSQKRNKGYPYYTSKDSWLRVKMPVFMSKNHIEIRGAFPLTCFVEIIFK